MKFAGSRNAAIKYSRSLKSHHNPNPNPDENALESYSRNLDQEDIKLQIANTKLKRKLTIRSFPFFFWLLGLVFIIFGILLLVNLILGEESENSIFKGFNQGYWWEYLIVGIIFSLGISFYITAKYESIHFDREKDLCVLSKTYLFCCSNQSIVLKISEIENIYAIKIGNVSTSMNSIIYKVGIRYGKQNKTAHIFKSLFERSVINNVLELRRYLFDSYDTYDSIKNDIRDGVIYS